MSARRNMLWERGWVGLRVCGGGYRFQLKLPHRATAREGDIGSPGSGCGLRTGLVSLHEKPDHHLHQHTEPSLYIPVIQPHPLPPHGWPTLGLEARTAPPLRRLPTRPAPPRHTPACTHNLSCPSLRAIHAQSLTSTVRPRCLGWLMRLNTMPRMTLSSSSACTTGGSYNHEYQNQEIAEL